MVIQIFQYINNKRITTITEYNSYDDFERDYLIMKLSDNWVGHRVFNVSLEYFLSITETQVNNLDNKSYFDRESYIKHYTTNGAK